MNSIIRIDLEKAKKTTRPDFNEYADMLAKRPSNFELKRAREV